MRKVLLVEDDETSNFISKMALQEAGIKDVEEALNGEQAREHIEKDCPDFIFLDIKMPMMDGWDFLDEMITNGLCKETKVAMLTSSTRPEDKKRAAKYDCVIAYLEKPLTKVKIKEIIDKLAS